MERTELIKTLESLVEQLRFADELEERITRLKTQVEELQEIERAHRACPDPRDHVDCMSKEESDESVNEIIAEIAGKFVEWGMDAGADPIDLLADTKINFHPKAIEVIQAAKLTFIGRPKKTETPDEF
jgi:hypothetical protein